nr:hypothetical protein [Anaerolineae bacterium]
MMRASLYHRLQGWGLFTYARIIGRTARYRTRGQANVTRARATGRPIIWTAWHGMTMLLIPYLLRHVVPEQTTLIVPDDHRGEPLATWARLVGAHAVPISMGINSLVSGRRLVALIRAVRGGMDCYVNPDGPDGPTHVPKPGVAFIARKGQACLLPMGAFASPKYTIPRWDRYSVPLPFARIAVVVGEPISVAPQADLNAICERLAAALNRAEAEAEALCRSRALQRCDAP